jgi:SAM-dependent methyltransferase
VLPGSGRCLDIASGTGAVSLWLAQQGLEVTALDLSDVAIGRLEAAATASGLSDRIDARTVDLDQGLPEDLADLDLIVCQRFRDPALYRPIVDRLRPGGLAVVTVLSGVGADDPGPFHAPAGELSIAFGSDERCEILREFEGGGVAHVVVRRR